MASLDMPLLTRKERADANLYDVEAQSLETHVVRGQRDAKVGEDIEFNAIEDGVSVEVRAVVVSRKVLNNSEIELGLRDVKVKKLSVGEVHYCCPRASAKTVAVASFALGAAALVTAAAVYTFGNN